MGKWSNKRLKTGEGDMGLGYKEEGKDAFV